MSTCLRLVATIDEYTWPRIAVVTRTHQRLKFLPRCFETLDGQNFQDFVHVIYCDGGGVSEVESLIRGYQSKGNSGREVVLLGADGPPLGRAAAGNAAMSPVGSEYAIFLDDDDTWDPRLLETLYSAVCRNAVPGVVGAVCQTTVVKERTDAAQNLVEIERYPFNDQLRYVLISEIVHRNLFTIHAFLFEVAVWRELGGYRPELLSLQDWEFNIRYCLRGELIVVPESLANWHVRIEPGSQSISGRGAGSDHGGFRAYIRNLYVREALAGRIPPLIAAMMQEAKHHSDTRDFVYGVSGRGGVFRRLWSFLVNR